MFETERCPENACNAMNYSSGQFAAGDTPMNFDMMNMGMNPMNNCCYNPCNVTMCPPVMECPQERVCHRTIEYEVPHLMPCHTRMINHHVYRHTYQPCYSYSEEDEYTNVYGQRCC